MNSSDAGAAAFDRDAARWLPGGHSQTIWAAKLARTGAPPSLPWRRERWDTPDGDFIDLDWIDAAPAPQSASQATAPLLVLFHGLEGSSNSHYVRAFGAEALARSCALVVPHFRGCSGQINRAPRAYHSGDASEIDWILRRLRSQRASGLVWAVGVSLGGNALLRWAAEQGTAAQGVVAAVAAVSSPLDLTASGHAMGKGFNRRVYTPMFLATMRAKARQKAAQYPGLFNLAAVLAARDLQEFDNRFTAPLHGYRDVADYWRRASALPLLGAVALPALALNALNDPFVPAESLPRAHQVSPQVRLWQPRQGGHVGFVGSSRPWFLPGQVHNLPRLVWDWLLTQQG